MVTAFDLISSNSQLQNHWVRRIAAAIVDGIILWVVAVIMVAIIAIAGVFGLWMLVTPGLFTGFFMGIIFLLYYIILEGMSGATLGKRFFNLKVVSTEDEMNMVKAAIRNVSKVVWIFGFPALLLLDWLAGFFTNGDPRQRYTDRIANTTVVRTDIQEIYAGAYQPPSGPMPAPYQPGSRPAPYSGSPSAAPPQRTSGPQAMTPSVSSEPVIKEPAPVTPTSEAVPEGEEAPKEFTRSELVNMRKDDLIKIARKRGLKISGTKRDLIDRILGEEVT